MKELLEAMGEMLAEFENLPISEKALVLTWLVCCARGLDPGSNKIIEKHVKMLVDCLSRSTGPRV